MTGGRFDFDDGGTYCGGWEDGKAHGHGICTGPKGQGEYAGSWSHGFEVAGGYTWPSGNTYLGYWAQGKRHGLGVETKGRWMYRGEWSHGFKGRYGVRQSLSTPARYEGTWSNGLQDGYGVETYGDGGTYQGQWTGGMRHGYGVRQSVPYGMATVIRSPLRTSLASLRSEQSNGTVLHDVTSDSPAGTRGGFVLNFHSDPEAMGIKKKGGLFRRGSLLGSIKLRKSESRSSISSKRSSVRSDAAMSRISSSDANSTISFGDGDCDYCSVEDHVDATTTETYMGEWKNDKRSGFGVSERSNGMKYEGEWLNNRRHGYGCTMFPDGTKEEGKYKNNVLVRGIRKQLIPIRNTKTREKVDRAIEGAQRAAAMARTKVEIATSRTAHARAKADAADQAAQAARQECDIARAVARELSPNFYQPGPDYIKQKFQEGLEVKEKSEEKVQEKPPTPKESPHFYRKGTTPPRTPEASPRHSPPLSSEPSPSKQLKRQSSTSGARLGQDNKKLLATENITPTINKPLYSKAPMKEEVAVKHQPKFSAHHNPISTENGELHGHYHGYYVKMNPPVLPQELREEDEYVNPSPSTLARLPPSQKPSPARSGGKPDAKENKPDTKITKPEFAAPKNPANNEIHSAVEKEVENSSGPNSVMIALVMLLNIGLAILFVHFLT
ncbi:junctophilin-1 [Phalacrocorax carbo]|uniref:junctophilin-1 n=1 Tax=Phalacrocorax carbo TaxID=9209 RepID=UPI00311A67F2